MPLHSYPHNPAVRRYLMTIAFKQARHYRIGPFTKDLIVIHSAEIGESLAGAEALMNVCAIQRVGKNGKEIVSSWHYACDADSITQSVGELDMAYHAPGANRNGIGIELSGVARQTQEDWQDAFSFYMLELVSKLCAVLCARHNIPITEVDVEDLRAGGARGITTHANVSKAFGKSTHWDPGPNFPMAHLLERTGYWSRTEVTL
jgi:N-acetyl-anhydromuramyl-L-alanine amidase AmpD